MKLLLVLLGFTLAACGAGQPHDTSARIAVVLRNQSFAHVNVYVDARYVQILQPGHPTWDYPHDNCLVFQNPSIGQFSIAPGNHYVDAISGDPGFWPRRFVVVNKDECIVVILD